jgi:hypothetical protein
MTIPFQLSGAARFAALGCRSGRGAEAMPSGGACIAAHRVFLADRPDEGTGR